ncbi:MAG: GNAT family N-acetyltransferase [Brevibacterium sp.]
MNEGQNRSDETAEVGAKDRETLRNRIRPLPSETADETFLPFLDLCFNWSMDKPRIELEELAQREDAAFYYKGWGRRGDIAVAARADEDSESEIIGLAWLRLADIDAVIDKRDRTVKDGTGNDDMGTDEDTGTGDDTGASDGTGNNDDTEADGDLIDNTVSSTEESTGDSDSASGEGDNGPFTGYGWVAADIPELSIAVLPDHQSQGIGGALLDVVCALARISGFPAVSLSVEDGNGAAHLYHDRGFVSVGRHGNSDILVRRLTTD